MSGQIGLLIIVTIIMLCSSSGFCEDTSALRGTDTPMNTIWLDSLDIKKINQRCGHPHAGKSMDNNPLTLNGVVYAHGIGTHALSEMLIDLKASAVKFTSMVGVDDECGNRGGVVFQIWIDGKKAVDSGVMHGGDIAKSISVDLTGAKHMVLIVTNADDGPDYDHADWANAAFTLIPNAGATPESVIFTDSEPIKIATGTPPEPAIHGPRIVGATPGRPFTFLIPVTGKGPLTYSAKNLPAGLNLDSNTGVISGILQKAGRTVVDISVTTALGSASRKLVILGGDHVLARTPPMGWNSWNVWAGAVDDSKIRAAADAMVESGLAAHGYQYINIDDCWQGERDANGNIQPNAKFPDMKALADYVHGKGLKFGIYSSPGPKTCAGFEGSYQHEDQDAMTYAKWGVDYLKHDLCSYRNIMPSNPTLQDAQKPYQVMRASLDKCGRDIIYSLCQYGMESVWKWGAEVGGNLWRISFDISDEWGSVSSIGFDKNGFEQFTGPGHWNDLDMLVVGKLGWCSNPRPSRLTQNEQITHMTIWAMLAAPLIIGCDMSQLDQFTKDILTNDEVLDIDQDPLGKAANRREIGDGIEIWTRPLWDGTMAVGLFNRMINSMTITVKWSDLGLKSPQPIRDLWCHRDLGEYNDSFSASVPAHGCMLLKVGRPNKDMESRYCE